MTCICIGPLCLPMEAVLPFLLALLYKAWAWLTGSAAPQVTATASCCAAEPGSAGADGSQLRQRKGVSSIVAVHTRAEWDALLASSRPVIVDFTATWCGPCKKIAPTFDALSEQYPSLMFFKIDVDACDDIAATCGVSAMPTFHVYVSGRKQDELCGANPSKLTALVERYAASSSD
ncbi:thioredoxin 1 [Saprolegnia diclina VS20]|uniref:Thioredoxin 1 n=1 Tax=Saprolegnia diclina (strain VS20) TaxID=1156394 RepID=T0RZP7_SAPDV|nr:thioredoxin 1 [Saprolegnia diclina VS20]EQC37978.1 thioredoxin 1 [Saprolegnia diclina VS20]|eukprot:XP_008608305.1 thioredoxin 1 [Saprolegnia diclina VS20]